LSTVSKRGSGFSKTARTPTRNSIDFSLCILYILILRGTGRDSTFALIHTIIKMTCFWLNVDTISTLAVSRPRNFTTDQSAQFVKNLFEDYLSNIQNSSL
jgi:hypothetical protein